MGETVEVLVINAYFRPGETYYLLSCRPYLNHFKWRDVVEKIVGFHKIGTLVLPDSVQFEDLVARELRRCLGNPARELQNRTFQIVNVATTIPAYQKLKEDREEEV